MHNIFLDTAFIQAILNSNDQYYRQGITLLPLVKKAKKVWLTEAILMEVGNALSAVNRQKVVDFIRKCYVTENIKVIKIDHSLFSQAINFYEAYSDKTWGLIDCISFVVMRENNLTIALTSDYHFIQAGFRALLREDITQVIKEFKI